MKGNDSVEAEPQQAIEACKMIHVGVGNESMRDTQEFARGQRRHVAEVKQQCPTAKRKSMNSAGSEKGSLTSRGCTSQVTSSPFSFRPHGHAAVAVWHRARLNALPGRNFVRAI